jgi:hypothetical protein
VFLVMSANSGLPRASGCGPGRKGHWKLFTR